MYNIYDECGKDERRKLTGASEATPLTFSQVRNVMSQTTVTVETADSFSVSAGYSQALNDYECGAETAMDEWLADPAVVAALHVKAVCNIHLITLLYTLFLFMVTVYSYRVL